MSTNGSHQRLEDHAIRGNQIQVDLQQVLPCKVGQYVRMPLQRFERNLY